MDKGRVEIKRSKKIEPLDECDFPYCEEKATRLVEVGLTAFRGASFYRLCDEHVDRGCELWEMEERSHD